MSTNVLQNTIAVENENQAGIIGHLTWYSVGQQLIESDELQKKLNNAGFGNEWMPKEIRQADAFRRATQEIKTKKKTDQRGVHLNYLIREVYSDRTMIQRNIVCETVDQQGKRLDYNGQAAILVLDKEHYQVEITGQDETAYELAKEAQSLFELYSNHHSAQHLRVMIMDILKSMSPTPVRPNGGVYLIPEGQTEILDKFRNFVNSLEAEAFKIQLVNSFDNRQMVVKKLTDHFQNIVSECDDGLEGNLKKAQVKDTIDEAKRVIGDFNSYRGTVTDDVGQLEQYIDTIRKKVSLMMESL